jgi:hypothetical protein
MTQSRLNAMAKRKMCPNRELNPYSGGPGPKLVTMLTDLSTIENMFVIVIYMYIAVLYRHLSHNASYILSLTA